jgi:ketosteroid isomerase-like protein
VVAWCVAMGKPRDARGVASKVAVHEPIESVDPVEPIADDDGASDTTPDRVVPPSLTRELTRVEEANLAFYDAFHKRDIDRMSQMWSRSPHARCVHPGWELVIGWSEIRQSWLDIFRTIQRIEFSLEDIHIEVSGRTAWVNLIAHVNVTTDDGEDFPAIVVTTNIFEEIDGRWLIVLHHSSNFADEEEIEEDELELDGSLDGSGSAGPN